MSIYSLKDIYLYSKQDLINFLTQFTQDQYEDINQLRYMTVLYLLEYDLLNQEDNILVINNKSIFFNLMEKSSNVDDLNFYLKDQSWNKVLESWENGGYLVLPEYATRMDGFFWRTLPINKQATSEYKQIFIQENFHIKNMDTNSFKDYINKGEEYGSVFQNPKKDTTLVIPSYHSGQNFAHFALFLKNSTEEQKKGFFKLLASAIRQELNNMREDDVLYVYTHGHGVSYLHVRLEKNSPKYFDSRTLNPNKMDYYIY